MTRTNSRSRHWHRADSQFARALEDLEVAVGHFWPATALPSLRAQIRRMLTHRLAGIHGPATESVRLRLKTGRAPTQNCSARSQTVRLCRNLFCSIPATVGFCNSQERERSDAEHSKSSHLPGRPDGGRECRAVQGSSFQCGTRAASRNDNRPSGKVGRLLLGIRLPRRRTDARRRHHRCPLRAG